MRHSLAANNGVMSLFSNTFCPDKAVGKDACVLKRLTLDNKADTEMQQGDEDNFLVDKIAHHTSLCNFSVLFIVPFAQPIAMNSEFTFSPTLRTKHY